MTIFDGGPHDLEGGARAGQPRFDYLNRSARREAVLIRATLEGFIERYPAPLRSELAARIRDEAAHESAVFELLLHEWCLRAGMRVLDVEPAVPGSRRRPDFLVEDAQGVRFYLEAALARGESDQEVGARRRKDDVLAALDRLDSPEFLLDIRTRGAPATPVALRNLTNRVTQWLATLDHTTVAQTWERGAVDDVFAEDLHSMRLELRPIPRRSTRGERDRRATGVIFGGVRQASPQAAIRTALINKATRYGALDLPLVVAVNALDQAAGRDDVFTALLGTEAYYESIGDEASGWGRVPDGVWNGPNGPQCRRLSAVLSTERLDAWSLGQRSACLIENPYALRVVEGLDFRVDAWRPHNNELRATSGIPLHEVFGLPHNWPE
ncbi:hypothetical protein [Microvirga arabica]|uniref:hypothetical protein n=1 Tax=Microvirga arabica TaxID=1128671 RepID=UPI00193A860D|nr:hypothetical protein [Microvirga arabica]MBM1170195.1 hypothetical protein [Microvirga arabica]